MPGMTEAPGYVLYQELPQRPLTARNLEDFALCPQKYLLSFFVPPAVSDRFRGGPAALHEAVREALVECYREGGPPAVAAERVLEVFERAWRGELCSDSREEEQLHAQGQEMLRRYLQEHAQESVRAIASDLRLEEELGGHRFVAVADRVDRGEEGLLFVRYKTTRQPPSEAELSRDLSATLLALVGEQHYGEPARAAVYALRRGKLILAAEDAQAREEAQREIVGRAGLIRRTREFATRTGRHCRVCRSREQCPAWHPAPRGEEWQP